MIPNDLAALHAFFMVFIRCGAALMSSPFFGAQNMPVQVRIFSGLAIAGAISLVVKPTIGAVPADMGGLLTAAFMEAMAGVLIGTLLGFTLQMVQVAGTFLDMQIGLSISQTLNPVTGVQVTIIGQFKYMLSLIVFLSMDGHHYVVQALVKSYEATGTFGAGSMDAIYAGVLALLAQGMMVAMQIAAPVMGVSMIVDAALGVINKAVPQLQPIQVGMPAKLGLGLAAVGLTLPALVAAVHSGTERAAFMIGGVFGIR